MQARRGADGIGVEVVDYLDAVVFCEIGHPAGLGKPGVFHVYLDNIDATPFHKALVGKSACLAFTGGDGKRGNAGQFMVALYVLPVEWLLQEEHVVILELLCSFDGGIGVPAATGVDDEVVFLSQATPSPLHELQVQLFALAHRRPAELHRGKPFIHPSLSDFACRLAVGAEENAGVGAKLLMEGTAQELVDRLVIVLAGNVPEGNVNGGDGVADDAATPQPDIAGLEQVIDGPDVKRVHAGNQPGQAAGARSAQGSFNHRFYHVG
ncbi:hypothetical protein ES703_63485 [subsurface metagenome]